MKRILKGQTWIEELKQIKAAVRAVQLYAARYIPAHIKQEMRIAAATSGVPYFDLVCCNLAYEIAMIATTPGKLDLTGMWQSLVGLPATRVGCTSFGYWGCTGHWDFPCNTAVLFARNLDWADPDGLLKRHTRSAKYKARPARSLWSAASPMKGFRSLTFPGYSGVLTGYAPGRFAVSLNAVFNDAAISFGAAPSMLTRQALETCRTYADAVKLLARTPLVCSALFTVIDADPSAGTNAGCVIERSAKGYAIRSAIPVGKNDWVVCATNDYLAIESGDVSDLPSEIGATSCNRYHKVITGLRNARLGLDDSEMVGVKDVRRILASTRFGCTVHSTVFDASDSKDLPWE